MPFQQPDFDRDKRVVEDEERQSSRTPWSEAYWKPTPGDENLIRVLPAKMLGVSYHMKAAKHFIKHVEDGKTESFVCMKEMYGKACPACEKYLELVNTDKPTAQKFKTKRVGIFNILDRNAYFAYREHPKEKPLPSVRLYEAPAKAIWLKIVSIVTGRGRLSNLFDEYDAAGNFVSPGRDILITFNPDAEPQSMYGVYPTDPSPLGSPDEVKIWIDQIVDLTAQNLYPPIEYSVAKIKTFGSAREREELRKTAAAAREAANVEDSKTKSMPLSAQASIVADASATPPLPPTKEDTKVEDKPAAAAAPGTPGYSFGTPSDADRLRAKVDALRKKAAGK